MTSKHFRVGGRFIGTFVGDGKPAEPDAVECPAPLFFDDVWDGSGWVRSPEREREKFKISRQEKVALIRVEVGGRVFDGDEVSQARMARAILGLQASGPDTSVTWVLADNSVVQVTAAELQQALALAGAEQTRLWVQE